jgi:hypothetical protein
MEESNIFLTQERVTTDCPERRAATEERPGRVGPRISRMGTDRGGDKQNEKARLRYL